MPSKVRLKFVLEYTMIIRSFCDVSKREESMNFPKKSRPARYVWRWNHGCKYFTIVSIGHFGFSWSNKCWPRLLHLSKRETKGVKSSGLRLTMTRWWGKLVSVRSPYITPSNLCCSAICLFVLIHPTITLHQKSASFSARTMVKALYALRLNFSNCPKGK